MKSLKVFAVISLIVNQNIAAAMSIAGSSNFELLILHNNDIHGRFDQTSQLSSVCSKAEEQENKCYGGIARVAHCVKEAREKARTGEGPPVLYLNAGDTYTGTIWFAVYKWEIAAAFLNILRPDAVSLGNHELDYGVSGMAPFIKNLTCPVLASNINVEKEPEIKDEPNLKKSIVLTVNGTKIGIIGYLTPETAFFVPSNKIEYRNEIEAIQEEVDRLRTDGVQILIALGHSGFKMDRKIAEQVEGIDLVIGGHTNTFLWNGKAPDTERPVGPYPTVIEQSTGKKVPVVQAYAFSKYLGKLHLVFDSNGELLEYSGQPILLDNTIPRDPEVLELWETFRVRVNDYTKEVVGISKVLLDGSTESCRLRECNVGNLVTDAMIYAYVTEYPANDDSWTNAPIAILHGDGVKSSIDPRKSDGNVTREDILSILPFNNDVVLVNVTGNVLRKALEWSVHRYDEVEMPGGFLQVSGLRVVFNLTRPVGHRVVSVKARCGDCAIPHYDDLNDSQYYNVLIPSFLSSGGGNFTMLKDEVVSKEFLLLKDATILMKYITKMSPIFPEVEGRTIVHKTSIVTH